MNWFDIAVLAVMALFLIYGFFKGFIKTAISLLSWGVSFLLIYLCAKKFGDMMLGTGLGETIKNGLLKIYNLGENGGAMVSIVDGAPVLSNGVTVAAALGALALPGFMKEGMLGFFTDGVTFEQGLGNGLGHYVMMVIAAIIIIIVVSIVFKIISIVCNKVFVKGGRKSILNRILGAVLQVGLSFFIISAVMLLFDMMSGFSFMAKVVETLNSSKIVKVLFVDNNVITLLINAIK